MTKTARTTTVSVRIDKPTAAEWREKAEASDLSLSDWIRGAIDANQQTHLPTPRKRAVRVRDTSHDADPVLMRQLAGMSNNLNQIARALNEYGTPYNALSGEVRAAIADLAALKFEVLRKVGEAVGNIQTYQL